MKAIPTAMLLLALILPAAAGARASAQEPDPSTDFSLIRTGRGLTFHKELYALPVTWANTYHGRQTEVIFQISAKHDVFGTRFYLAYSQISFWQAYDSGNSAPFRDTNYNPEVFYRFRERAWGPGLVGGDAGFEHESNGQRVPLSRSWNLLYVAPFVHGDHWLLYLKARYRLPEDDKETPDSALGDDNPDITDYLGHSDVHFYYALPRGHLVHLLVRGYVGTDKGNVSLNYSIPVPRSAHSFLVLRLFSGYGESMLDYRRATTRVGVGLMFNR